MADLQDEVFFLGQFAQLGGLRGIVGHRFFDEDMLAGGEQLFGDVKVRGGGRGDVGASLAAAASAMEAKTLSLCFAAMLRAVSA